MQEKVITQLARGLSNEEIAGVLYLDKRTVKNHIYNMMQKMKFSNRVQLAVWWIRNFES